MFSFPDTTERNEVTIQLGIIVGSSVGGVVLIAALLVFLIVCLIVICCVHADSRKYMKLLELAIKKRRTLAEVREYVEDLKQIYIQQPSKHICCGVCLKKRVVADGEDEEDEIQKKMILNKFFKDVRKL